MTNRPESGLKVWIEEQAGGSFRWMVRYRTPEMPPYSVGTPVTACITKWGAQRQARRLLKRLQAGLRCIEVTA